MATRHNACVNPALGVDAAGWGGEASPTRTSVAGFDRPQVAQYSTGTFMRTPGGAVTPGLDYTLSVYLRPANGLSAGNTIYIEWHDSGGGTITYTMAGYSIVDSTVTRASVTGTAPAGAATAQMILDGINYTVTTVDASMVLIEQTSALAGYFDGDSTNGSWDGTPGSSASTLTDAVPVTGTLAAALPALTAAASGTVRVTGQAAATLPPLTATMQAAATATGTVSAVLPPLAAALTGAVRASGTINAVLPALTAQAAGAATIRGHADATLPPLTAALTGQATARADLTATLPPLTAQLAGEIVTPSGTLTAVLPALTAALVGHSDAVDLPEPAIRVGPPQLGWPVRPPFIRWQVQEPTL